MDLISSWYPLTGKCPYVYLKCQYIQHTMDDKFNEPYGKKP